MASGGNDIYQITSDNYNKNIYILTHPIWWSNEKSSPRNKIKTLLKIELGKINRL